MEKNRVPSGVRPMISFMESLEEPVPLTEYERSELHRILTAISVARVDPTLSEADRRKFADVTARRVREIASDLRERVRGDETLADIEMLRALHAVARNAETVAEGGATETGTGTSRY